MTIWLILGVLVLGIALLWVINKVTRRRRAMTERDRAIILDKWHEIEELMNKDRMKEAIFEADKLLDWVFKKINLRGESFADRLRSAEKLLNNYQDIWGAHKLRNRFAHELDFQPSSREAQRAIDTFDQAIRKLIF